MSKVPSQILGSDQRGHCTEQLIFVYKQAIMSTQHGGVVSSAAKSQLARTSFARNIYTAGVRYYGIMTSELNA